MDLQSLIDQSTPLPTVPQVTQRVIVSLGSDEVTTAEIARLLETDPVLSAKLLRLANSAYFQVGRTVESVGDAVRVLGLAMVRNLVLAGGMASAFDKVPGIDLHQFWTYSLYTACTGRWLAQQCGAHEDLVFTAGLLHGIGQLHLHGASPAAMASLDRQMPVLHAGRLALETQALGFNFATVSAALVRHWNFPASLVEPLEQLALEPGASGYLTHAALVHLGAWYARHLLANTPPTAMLAGYPAAATACLQLSACWISSELPTAGGRPMPPIPEMQVLTRGLDEMLY